jgi:hypothetical protein
LIGVSVGLGGLAPGVSVREVSKRLGSPYRSGRSPDWIKSKNPQHRAVKREAEEDWSKRRWK